MTCYHCLKSPHDVDCPTGGTYAKRDALPQIRWSTGIDLGTAGPAMTTTLKVNGTVAYDLATPPPDHYKLVYQGDELIKTVGDSKMDWLSVWANAGVVDKFEPAELPPGGIASPEAFDLMKEEIDRAMEKARSWSFPWIVPYEEQSEVPEKTAPDHYAEAIRDQHSKFDRRRATEAEMEAAHLCTKDSRFEGPCKCDVCQSCNCDECW